MIKLSTRESKLEKIKESYNFKSLYTFGNYIKFDAMERHKDKWGIVGTDLYGMIVGIRFTKAKVFYDVVDDYYGYLFDNIDSSKVEDSKLPNKNPMV